MSSWETAENIYKFHRFLTEGEANWRRTLLSIVAALPSPIFYLIWPYETLIAGLIPLYIGLFYMIHLFVFPPPKTDARNVKTEKKDGEKPAKSAKEEQSKDDEKGPIEIKAAPLSAKQQKRASFLAQDEGLVAFMRDLELRPTVYLVFKLAAPMVATYLFYQMLIRTEMLMQGILIYLVFFAGIFTVVNYVVICAEKAQIEDYPTKAKEKLIMWVRNKFAYSRNAYFIGEVQGKKIGLTRNQRFLHTLIGGPTGEGKSSSLIIPPLLFDADSVGSAVVPDAKSPELFNWVAGRWLKAGKKVYLFDPWHPDTVGINPIPLADDQDLLTIVEVMTREREDVLKEDPFFKARTRYMLFALLKLVQSFKDKYCTFSTLFRVCESQKTLQKFINTAPPEVKKLFDDYDSFYPETRVNTLTSIRNKLDIFMDSKVRKAFSRSEFTLDQLFKEGEACLLVLGAPIDKKEPGTKIASLIVNLIVNNAFRERRMLKQAAQKGETSNKPNDLYLYLDELRNLKITALADLVSIARETKTHVIGSVTDLGFFRFYREEFDSLMGNFRTRIYMGGLDYNSARYISDSLGKSKDPSYRMLRDDLMISREDKLLKSPDEVMNLKEHSLIVFSPKTRPFGAKKVSIYTTPWLKGMRVPPPSDMVELYKKWGLRKVDLVDEPLPKKGDGDYNYYDMKAGPEDKRRAGVKDSAQVKNATDKLCKNEAEAHRRMSGEGQKISDSNEPHLGVVATEEQQHSPSSQSSQTAEEGFMTYDT